MYTLHPGLSSRAQGSHRKNSEFLNNTTMTLKETLAKLKALGNEKVRKINARNGA
jgi:hypothetical protein